MKILKLAEFRKDKKFKQIMARSKQNYADIFEAVKKIMEDVKENGDEAVRKYTKKFGKVDVMKSRVDLEETKNAYKKVSADFLEALKRAINNITQVQRSCVSAEIPKVIEPQTGISVWKKWVPIEKVGLYVPGGRAIYPSSVLMNAIPAKIAGCKQIVIVTPPQKDGSIAPELLVSANELGVTEIYKIGGAQAIAALTYGTESIPKVYKIVGPGNSYVTSAKLYGFMSGEVAIDSPAGPSEVFIIADETASPKFIAADLMADAEHGPDGAAVLVTTSETLAKKVVIEIKNNINCFSTRNNILSSMKNYGLLALAASINEAVDFANDYAPEHILIMTKNATRVAERIKNAGSVFIGDYTCKSAGDYATGANHVLPTGGSAKMFSGLSVFDFMRLVEYQKCDKNGLQKIRKTIQTFAEVEGLPAHKYSCEVRFNPCNPL